MRTFETIEQEINDILENIEFADVNVLQFVDVDDILEDDNIIGSYGFVDRVTEDIEDARGFDVEIIYYKKAMQYLMDYDSSLCESMEIAQELCYKVEDLNSETLASLHASKCAREEFDEQISELDEAWELIEEYRELKEQEED